MGRIKKAATERHTATMSPAVGDFVSRAVSTPLYQLPQTLDSFPQHWPLPRGDLYHWIPLLDRFDHILELFNKEYGLADGPQAQPFSRRLLLRGDKEEHVDDPHQAHSEQQLDSLGYSEEGDEELVESVLLFTRILLEHCGNRSLYASTSHINQLLYTTSLSLLRAALKLGLRLAQRYQVARYKNQGVQNQAVVKQNHYNFELDNLQKIAQPFPKPTGAALGNTVTPGKGKEKATQQPVFNPCDLISLVKDQQSVAKYDLASVTCTFYEPSATGKVDSIRQPAEATPPTPTPIRRASALGPSRDRPSPGDRSVSANDVTPDTPIKSREPEATSVHAPKVYHLTSTKVSETPSWALVKEAIQKTPKESQYDLLNRIRIASAFVDGNTNYERILEVRLLAVANLAYALPEKEFTERLGQSDAEEPRRFHLAVQLCELLQPAADGQSLISLDLETTVVQTIEALSRCKPKLTEVADSLSLNANHGVLYYELRKVVATLHHQSYQDEPRELHETEWREAVFELVNSLANSNPQHRHADKMLSAGIVTILVEVLTLRTDRAERFYERILGSFDSFVHGLRDAFQTLANAKGLDAIADLTEYEVQKALRDQTEGKTLPKEFKSKVVDYNIPYFQQASLRQLLRIISHLFDAGAGVHDFLLRNLIDTPQILDSLLAVITNAHIFGSNVFNNAIGIVSTFIHNEPTSYQIIAEAGLSKGLLETVVQRSLPEEPPENVDVSLRDDTPTELPIVDGQMQFPSVAGILPVGETMQELPTAFGAICLNESGMKLFQASGALTEFLNVFVSPTHVRALEEEGQTTTNVGQQFDELARHHPQLKEQILHAVVVMVKRVISVCKYQAAYHAVGAKLFVRDGDEIVADGGAEAVAAGPVPNDSRGCDMDDDEEERAFATPYVSACTKFLEGFLHNNSMCTLFCEHDGAELMMDLVTAPSTPYDFQNFMVSNRLGSVIKAMADQKPHLVIPSIINRIQTSLKDLQPLMDGRPLDAEEQSFVFDFSELKGDASTPLNGTKLVKALVNTQLATNILSRAFATPAFNGHRHNPISPLFHTINFTDMYIQLVDDLSRLYSACLWESLVLRENVTSEVRERTDPKPWIQRKVGNDGKIELIHDTTTRPTSSSVNDKESTEAKAQRFAYRNVRTLRYLLSQTPAGIEHFFHQLSQTLAPKRLTDNPSKYNANEVADHLAMATMWQLQYRRFSSAYKRVKPETSLQYEAQLLDARPRSMQRPAPNMEYGGREALTLVLSKFYLAGGFKAFNKLLKKYFDMVRDKTPGHDHARGALASILSFYQAVCRSKSINDANQSNSIAVRELNQADYFHPSQFLVELRDVILPAVNNLWHAQDSEVLNSNIKNVVEILRVILKGEGEEKALKRSQNAKRKVPAEKPPFKFEHLAKFLGAGFSESLSKEALFRCNNDEHRAREYCLLHTRVQRAPRFPFPESDDQPKESTNGSESASVEMIDPVSGLASDNQIPEVSSPDQDMMSDDDNFGTLGHIPQTMLDGDLDASMPLGQIQNMLASRASRRSEPSTAPPAKDTEEPFVTLEDLEEKRSKVKDDLIERCLDVLSVQPFISFDLAELILAAVSRSGDGAQPRTEIATTLVSSLMSLQGEEPDDTEDSKRKLGQKISGYAHLVALILQDRDFFDSTLDELKGYFESLVAWIQTGEGQKSEGPPWIAMLLLIIERVLAEDEQPEQIQWSPPPADNPLQPLPEPEILEQVVADDVRSTLFDALVDLLPKVGKNGSLALSISRVLVILTRRRNLAVRLGDKKSMQGLFVMIRQLAGSVDEKLHGSFMLILRHMVEDEAAIRQTMRTEIRTLFESHRHTRALDTTTYVRNLYHLVLRDPTLFTEVTNDMLEISRYDSNPHRAQGLALKKNPESAPEAIPNARHSDKDNAPADADSKAAEPQIPMAENTDGVINLLLRELSNYREVDDTQPVPRAALNGPSNTHGDVEMSDTVLNGMSNGNTDSPEKTDKPTFRSEEHPIFVYRCFILQCLAELLRSYNDTKLDFINFSRKGETTQSTPSKPRSGTINYLLNVLIPVGTLESRDEIGHRKKLATSHWATAVLVALCSKTPEKYTIKSHDANPEEDSDLVFVRKFVLEHALRSFKDAMNSSETLDQRYSRLLALSALFSEMLTGAKQDLRNGNPTSEAFAASSQQLGRLMYERNFIGTLTSAIAEIDLNFPNAKRAVKYILMPLKWLTELAVTLSQSGELSSNATTTEEDEISSATSISEEEDDREQTPDLLRLTTLGDNDEDDSDEEDDDDDDEEMYDQEVYDDQMDYEEEAMPEHGDVVSDEDEDEAIDGMGEVEGIPGDVDMDVEVIMEGEDDDSEDEEEDDDDDELDEDEDQAFANGLDEVTGDDENASLADDHDAEGDWEDEGGDFVIHGEHDGSPHGGPLEHIAQVIGAGSDQDEDGVIHVNMGDGEEDEYFEDEMPPEDDEEDEEGAEGEYDNMFEPELEEDDDEEEARWDALAPPPRRVVSFNRARAPPGFHEMFTLADPNFAGGRFRSHRGPITTRAEEDPGINPLLQRDGGATPSGRSDQDNILVSGNAPHRRRLLPRGLEHLHELLHRVGPDGNGTFRVAADLGGIVGGMAGPVISIGGRHGPIIEMDAGSGAAALADLRFAGSPRWADMYGNPSADSRSTPSTDEARAVDFRPLLTTQRWQEEARLLYNNKHHDKATRVINTLLRLLVPPAMEAKRLHDKAEAERREAEEKAREEERKKAEAEQAEREAKEKQERQEREEREAREAEEAAARAREQEAREAEAEAAAANQEHDGAAPAANADDTSMEGLEQTVPAESEAQAEEQPTEPIMITIRGRELDVSNLGMDREWIEALPEDLLEEVIMARVAEQRSVQVEAGEQPSEISREFLEALPAEIQQELLRQEARDRRHRERDEARRQAQQAGNNSAPQPEDMNNADFMATLDPTLRRTILMDADDAMLAALPENLQREAQQLFGNRQTRLERYMGGGGDVRRLRDAQHRQANEAVTRQRRPVVQMLDKSGIATLLRLMFVSLHAKAKSALHGILSDICKNTQNRAEVISILLSILQDGTADVGAVERSFAQLSLRAKQMSGQKTPQPLKRALTNQMLGSSGTDLSPLNIVHQCLTTLKALTEDNSRVPSFFLSEHETASASQKLKNVKKGKNIKAAKFPINALLTLLDRKLIIENTGVMETLASLLSRVTHPLQILLKRSREEAEAPPEKQTSEESPMVDAPPAAPSADEQQQQQPVVEEGEAANASSSAAPETLDEGAVAEKTDASKESKKKHRELTPPEVPEENMRLIVNILAARECSSQTFREALDIVKNLSLIPGAKEVFGKELIRQAQDLGQAIAEDLASLAKHIDSAESGTDLQGMALASFSTSSAKQRKLLRVLIALDHLFDPKFVPSTPNSDTTSLKTNVLSVLYESTIFDKLWQNLSICLTAIRKRGNMINVATILLPVIESLHVVCRNVSLRDPQDTTPATPEGRLEELFFRFTEEHRKILNELVRNNPKLIHGNLSVLAKNSKVLEFDNKRTFFSRKLHSRSNQDRIAHNNPLQLNVRRDQVFLDSFKSLYYKTGNEIKYGKLNIKFTGEEGIDAGGVSREWFGAMARQMFNPDYCLFNPVAGDRTTFHPNPLSDINSEHLLFFKFIGRIIGKALYEGRLLDAHFSRAVYKKILGKAVSLKDMESVDLDFYRSLEWILNNDITDITFEKFCVEVDRFGEQQVVDLIPDGRNIDVTEDNKQEYVRLIVEHRLINSVSNQLDDFLLGFYEIIPKELVSIFNEQELELLISGLPDIDIDDWRNNSEYHNYQATSPQIQWFWRAVRSFDKEEQAKLLQFVTGTSKVPLNGFTELEGMNGFAKFNIHRDYSSNKDKLPTSHTCFNQLDLPEYESYERLRQQLYTAITAGSEYFGFA